MELLRENIIDLIRETCSSHWELNVFNGHIIVNLPDAEKDFRSIYNKVKQEITKCIRQHFPDRDEELLFEVRNCSWNCSFKLGKTTL
ncbi:hypothetical protein [Mucilaginibacter sp.]|uniref:hypothetical protein n=1 Tax=Mucilaginibacter sp. TaxID=1882438 RepID=UPI002610887A|nr:hypothetical protein [Mucilaginibacter sp.]